MNVNSDNILIERSKAGMNQKPPIKDIGIPRETQNANLGFRKIAKTRTTRKRPWYEARHSI